MAYDNGPLILGVTWMESGFTVIAIAVRFFARVTVTNNVGIDDWVMLLAVVRPCYMFYPLVLFFHSFKRFDKLYYAEFLLSCSLKDLSNHSNSYSNC